MKLILTFCCVFFAIGIVQAQNFDSRATYDYVQTLLEQEKWFEAKAVAIKGLKSNPDDLAFQLGIALASETEITHVPLFKWQQITDAYKEAIDNYKKVLDIKNGQVNEGKPFFAKVINDSKPSGKEVVAFCELRIQNLDAYYKELQEHETSALVAEKAYDKAIATFSELVKKYNYADNLPIYITSEDLTILDQIDSEFIQAKQLINALDKSMQADAIPLSNDNKIVFKWGKATVSGRNVAVVSENDFLRREVTIFDLHEWAIEVKKQGQAVNQLRDELHQHIATLNAGHTAPLSMEAYQQKEKEIADWHKRMTVYDDKCYLNYLTKYYLDKAKFYAMEQEYYTRREASFLHKELRSQLIKGIYQQIDTAFNSLRYIAVKTIFMPNQEPVLDKMGGIEHLTALQKQEDSLWLAEKSHWSGIEFSSHTLRNNISDELQFDGMSILTRPAKGDIAKEQAAGKYTIDEIESLADATTLIYGRGKDGAFVAKVLLDGSVQWASKYPNSRVVYATDYHDGAAMFVLKNTDEQQVLMAKDPKGAVLMETKIAFTPQTAFKVPAGVFLQQYENNQLSIMSCNFTDTTSTTRQMKLDGKIVTTYTKDTVCYVGVNYQSMSNIKGQVLDAGSESNVAIGIFYLSGMQDLVKAYPMGKKAVLVQIADTGKEVKAIGFKGNYSINRYGSYTGGESWEQVIE